MTFHWADPRENGCIPHLSEERDGRELYIHYHGEVGDWGSYSVSISDWVELARRVGDKGSPPKGDSITCGKACCKGGVDRVHVGNPGWTAITMSRESLMEMAHAVLERFAGEGPSQRLPEVVE